MVNRKCFIQVPAIRRFVWYGYNYVISANKLGWKY